MTRNAKLSLAVVGVFAVALAGLLVLSRSAGTASAEGGPVSVGAADVLVREDTHTLGTAGDAEVTLVEFLDFECEACLALYPTIERLREEYDGRVRFAVRYFPIPSHPNAELAAQAVEAAARQGEFEAMYQRMYETQTSWGHQETSQRDAFVGYAEDLGLDIATFRADLDDPAVAQRVAADQDDGLDLGVQGTPTLFLDGEMLPPVGSYEQLKAAIDAELAG